MSYTYVGVTPRFLASGRPVVFGDVLEDSDLGLADSAITAHLDPPLDEPALADVNTQPAPEPAQPESGEAAPVTPETPDPEAT